MCVCVCVCVCMHVKVCVLGREEESVVTMATEYESMIYF